MVHGQVRQEMRLVLSATDPISFLDETGSKLSEEARGYYRGSNIGEKPCFVEGKSIVMPTWQSDWVNDALALLLTAKGLQTSNEGVALQVHSTEVSALERCLREIAEFASISPDHLRLLPEQPIRQKWDWSLLEKLRGGKIVSSALDLEGARIFALEHIAKLRCQATRHRSSSRLLGTNAYNQSRRRRHETREERTELLAERMDHAKWIRNSIVRLEDLMDPYMSFERL